MVDIQGDRNRRVPQRHKYRLQGVNRDLRSTLPAPVAAVLSLVTGTLNIPVTRASISGRSEIIIIEK